MDKWFEWFVILVVPFFVWAIATFRYDFMWVPVFFFFWNKSPSFKDKNFFAGRRQFMSNSAAATTGSDYNNIIVICHNKKFQLQNEYKASLVHVRYLT